MRKETSDQIYIPSKNGYIVINSDEIREKENKRESDSKFNWLLYTLKNRFQFGLMLLSMVGIATYIGYAIGGILGAFSTMIVLGFTFFAKTRFRIEQILSKKNVRLIRAFEGTKLYQLLDKLVGKAGLEKSPYLFMDYSPEINAYTVEDDEKSANVLSKGLLENLNQREVYGVMAHEVAHLKNNDVRIMLFTDQIRTLTGYMAFFGQILLFFSLPFLLVNQITIPWIPILLLIASPTISFLFHVALSRNREFRADLDATSLTGDAEGLAMALEKIHIRMGLLNRLYSTYLKKVPEMLRTHPNTQTRITRLKDIGKNRNQEISWVS